MSKFRTPIIFSFLSLADEAYALLPYSPHSSAEKQIKRTVKSRGYLTSILADSRTADVPLALSSAPGAKTVGMLEVES